MKIIKSGDKMKKAFKILFIILGILLALVVAFLIILNIASLPTPDFLRNEKVDGIMMTAKISNDDREPIIRTFEENEYKNLSAEKLDKLKDRIYGRVEGDIPVIDLNIDNKVYFNFYLKDEIVKPDENPKIRIYASASHYKDKDADKPRIVNGQLNLIGNDTYIYEFTRYRTQFEKYFLEPIRIEIYYSIDGEKYVSTLATYTGNATEGTDYFNNENLDKPIPPEV